jgi:hypothetical protein
VKPTLPTFVAASAAAFSLLWCCEGAKAQGLEASRYVNAQGVEMLVSRNSARPVEAVPEDTRDAATPTAAAVTGKAAKAATGSAFVPVALRETQRVSGQQQTARDQDRQRILVQELMTEEQQLELKRRLLRSPRAQADLTADEQRRINEAIERHESNIRSLQREMTPARSSLANR